MAFNNSGIILKFIRFEKTILYFKNILFF